MTDELPTPLWRLKGDGYSDVVIVNGTVYPVGAPRRSWELPANLRDHEPVNWTAKFIARYNARLFHHPLRPRSASTKHGIFLPSVLIFGGSCTGYLGEGGVPDDAPRYKYSGTLLTWPGSYQTKYDGPENKSAELVLNWWRENKDRLGELDESHRHSPWCALRDALFLPALSTRKRPEELPPYAGPMPGSKYVPLDGRLDAAMVPARPTQPPIRTRTFGETSAVRKGLLDPTGRR
jgi:hypothetical protein